MVRNLRRDGRTRSLGFVRWVETHYQIRYRLRTRLSREGATTDRLTVFTDGDANLRRLQLDVLPNARHLLDWWHLTRHMTVLNTLLDGREAIEKAPIQHYRALCKALKSLKWRLWYGQH